MTQIDPEHSLRPIVASTIALGAVMLSAVGLLGDLWPGADAPVKAELNQMMTALFFALQANLPVLMLAYALAPWARPLFPLVNLFGVVVFLAAVLKAGYHFDRLLHIGPGSPSLDALVPDAFQPLAYGQLAILVLLIAWAAFSGIGSFLRRRSSSSQSTE